MDPYYTREGNRDDLLVVQAPPVENAIADRIFPVVPVLEKAGSVAYATPNSYVSAQTNRVAGAAPTGTQVANSATTFSCSETISRYSITPDEAKQMGNIDKADEVGARGAKYSVFGAIELAACTATLGVAASNNFDPAKIQTDIQTAIDSVELHYGRLSMIASTKTVKAMVQAMLADNTHSKVLARLVNGTSPGVAATGLNFQAWVDALAMYLGIDQVLLGNDLFWNNATGKGKFAIAKLDDGMDPLSHKYLPVLGKRFQFLRDGTNPFFIEAVADRNGKNNHYDCAVWYQMKTLNAGALYVFDGVKDA